MRRRGVAREEEEEGVWSCTYCTYENREADRVCEVCAKSRESEEAKRKPTTTTLGAKRRDGVAGKKEEMESLIASLASHKLQMQETMQQVMSAAAAAAAAAASAVAATTAPPATPTPTVTPAPVVTLGKRFPAPFPLLSHSLSVHQLMLTCLSALAVQGRRGFVARTGGRGGARGAET